MPPSVHPDSDCEPWLRGHLEDPAQETWLAEVDGAPVAYLRLTPTWLDDLYVTPSYAGQGLGTALLDLAKTLRPDGFGLWVFEVNTPARAFYRRHGLVEVERTDGRANEERDPDVRLAFRP
ncbi:MAG: GNAT family N-acetyltransferase [Nocardioides sp.]|nr:GNAT family N-acetyltransferase [Nocardioides sp.]